MDKKQNQQLDSFQSTDFILTGNTNIWDLPSFAKFVNNVGEFRGQLSEVLRYKQMQITDVHGATRFAALARIEMANKSVKVRSAVQNLAADNKDTMLYQLVRFPKSKLQSGAIQKSIGYARKIAAEASANILDLAGYKLTQGELDAYILSIENFQKAHSQVNQIRKERKNATAQLAILCPATRETIETKLRPGATQFMETAPDFYNELINSFEINDYPTHYTEFDIMTKDKSTGAPLDAVRITATSDKGTMVQFSNPVGAADFKQFQPDWWTITYECPGYETLIMKNVKADRGVKLELVAELEKIN
jgi:hypothetical protein